MSKQNRPQIKICGLTDPGEALKCAEYGADAIGLIFYPKSPRNVSDEEAIAITSVLPEHVSTVGIFVNESYDYIIKKVNTCGLKAVQLHGSEPPELVSQLGNNEGLTVLKCLYMDEFPSVTEAGHYGASAFVVECGKGVLPGGNAMKWAWGRAKSFGEKHPFILAGGLSPDNIVEAATACLPDAVDVSSGVELSPGRKDLKKVKDFIDAVSQISSGRITRRIF